MPATISSIISRFHEFPFYINAFSAGLAIALMCGLLSIFVVYRKMAFIGEGISHAAFGAAGLVLLAELYWPPLRNTEIQNLVIASFLIIISIFIGFFSGEKNVSEDSAIGIMLVTSMAAGVLLINLRSEQYAGMLASGSLIESDLASPPSFHDLLFGNILTIPSEEVHLMWLVALSISALVLLFFQELMFLTFDEEGAYVFGLRTEVLRFGLLITLALAIFFALRMVGVLLATAFLIFPASIARLLSSRIYTVTLLSILFSCLSVIAGLFLTIRFTGLSTGPVIVLVLFFLFVIAYIINMLYNRFSQNG